MRVAVAEVLFDQEGIQGPLLALVLACGFSWVEHHRVVVERDGGGAYDRWLADLPSRSREEVESLMAGWVREDVQPALGGEQIWTVRLLGAGGGNWNTPVLQLGVFEAFRVLSRPFEIHVEDDLSDRAFLLSIARPEWRGRIEELEKAGRLVFFHGGGVVNMLRRIKRLENGDVARRLRIWAMFDSDGLRPGKTTSQTRNLRSAADRLIAGRWMLARRFVESYIPGDHVERWAEEESLDALFEAWMELDDDHRRHFNMKKGLRKDQCRDDFRGAIAAFWSDHTDTTALQDGFGRKIVTMFEGGQLRWSDYDMDARAEADEQLLTLMRML